VTVTVSRPDLPRVRPRIAPALPRLGGLDGLRAFAVLAVVAYHADVEWAPGGFLGVDVFFVLSGFLITSLLLVELDRSGRVDLGRFYLRRARRLLPALLAVLVVTGLMVASVAYDAAGTFRRDLPGVLAYVSNWSYILTDTSYFEAIGRPPMLAHLWSLAVEEQFYLIWPLVCLLLYRWRGARLVGRVALGAALASALAMAVASVVTGWPAAGDPSRLYFGTDTHAMGILLGAALAVVWRPGNTAPVLPRSARVVISAAGVVALGLLTVVMTHVGESSAGLYRGGFLGVAVLAAVVVASASHRGAPFGVWLGNRPMRWIGVRSYGIYLWHWPLFLVTRPGVDLPFEGGPALMLRMALLIGVAELSYRYLELPVRRGALGRWWARLRAGHLAVPTRNQWIAVATAAALLVAAGWRIAVAPGPAAQAAALDEALTAGPAPTGGLGAEFERQRGAEGLDPRTRITAFGDSVLIGAERTMEDDTFKVDLYAGIGRQAGGVESSIRTVAAAGDLRPRVLIHVGTNGNLTEDELDGMLDAVTGAQRVVLTTIRVPRPWQDRNNEVITKVAATYPNVVVADWHGTSEGHRDWFVTDGVHLTATGAKNYNALIARTFGVPVQP
jgi:peptidoglycan/LPS O-acetylase OafA/YrhL